MPQSPGRARATALSPAHTTGEEKRGDRLEQVPEVPNLDVNMHGRGEDYYAVDLKRTRF